MENKAVRIRPKGISVTDFDIRIKCVITTDDDNDGNDIIKYTLTGYTDYEVSDGKGGFQRNIKLVWKNSVYISNDKYTDSDTVIKDFIKVNSLLNGKSEDYWEIIQDPWLNKPPSKRNYGRDPYYLNNGSFIIIEWLDDKNNSINVIGEEGIGKDEPLIPSTLTKCKNKKILIVLNKDVKIIIDNNEFKESNISTAFSYSNNSDVSIIERVIFLWKKIVPNYNLELCNPSNTGYSNIELINPINKNNEKVNSNIPEKKEDIISKTIETPTNNNKIKMVLSGISETYDIKVLNKLPAFKVFVGDIPDEENPNIDQNNSDSFNPTGENEYVENIYQGEEEVPMELIGSEVAISQIDCTDPSNMGPVGAPVDIQPVGSFDELLKLAGKCARALGKNPRVKYENLRQGYISGVHGLCPQGTQAVLYALTGVKGLGMLPGNADFFTFKYGGGKTNFPSEYFNDKIKVDISYWNDKTRWQIGDVIAVGYTGGKLYGHIQVWTGVNWMSDFKQNGLQRSHVDWDTAALWRLNSKGVAAVKKQSGTIA